MAIYSYLQGGLGNQMFQYAIARALSEHYQSTFLLDRSWFDAPQAETTPRPYQLDLLNIKEGLHSEVAFPKRPNKLMRSLQKWLPVGPAIYYQQNAFEFDARLLHLKAVSQRDLFLFGYWQAFPYIETIRPILQGEFKTKKSVAEHYQPYLEQIRSSEAVMLHIRRGDYVNSPSAAKFHGVLPLSYYQQAIEALLLNQPNAHFFIFSDDLPWAKEALPKDLKITFIENSSMPDAAAQELQLMYECQHHIIANSSLSWWGAWLKKDCSGLVFAPNRWISDSSLDLSNLLPANWQRIPA
jgi:Glycosyl transferase family 11